MKSVVDTITVGNGELLLSIGRTRLSNGFHAALLSRIVAAGLVAGGLGGGQRVYADPPPATPIIDSAVRLAAREAHVRHSRETPAASGRGGASWAEKSACAYLMGGGVIFVATAGGEKNADGTWSRDGKAEMAGGIGALAISAWLLWDILHR
ncbi:MAG TPA: hypothetical protein VL309_05515 [Vicinamibacterales bacterium]|jgi:hypothetical protein|nr:hypothetical protein [Vicinamibacterales bacterium]